MLIPTVYRNMFYYTLGLHRGILPKWSKNEHFFEIKKKYPKHYFFASKAIFLILDIILRVWVNFHKKVLIRNRYMYPKPLNFGPL